MKIKQNKKGAALVFTMIILSIGVIVGLSIAATSVITRKNASSVQKSNQAFQEADSASDAFDKIIESTEYTLCHVRDYFDDDSNVSTADPTCPNSNGGTHRTDFGNCMTSGDDNGKIISNDQKFITTIEGAGGAQINCYSNSPLTDIKKTKIIGTEGQNKRVIVNVPPCADFDANDQTILAGRWPLDSSNQKDDVAVRSDGTLYDNDIRFENAGAGASDPRIGSYQGTEALVINEGYLINSNDSNYDSTKLETSSENSSFTSDAGYNKKFNFAKIQPQMQYKLLQGAVAFWYYSENIVIARPTPKQTFSMFSRDINNCINDYRTMPGCAGNDREKYCGGLAACGYPAANQRFNDGGYCDCGHMSFLVNTRWDGYPANDNLFGTRFQEDGNGSHYPLFAKIGGTGNPVTGVTGEWHLVAISFDSGGPKLYYDKELVGEINEDYLVDGYVMDQDDFEGWDGTKQWIYLGLFAGSFDRTYNDGSVKDQVDKCAKNSNKMDGECSKWEDIDGPSGSAPRIRRISFKPFIGGIKDLRIYNRKLRECEVRRIWKETKPY